MIRTAIAMIQFVIGPCSAVTVIKGSTKRIPIIVTSTENILSI